MSTAFTFIDHARIDGKSRRAIRSHVMKGKNVGKIRVPRTSRALIGKSKTVEAHEDVQIVSPETSSQKATISINTQRSLQLAVRVGNDLTSLGSQLEITAQSRRSIHNFLGYVAEAVYPAEFCKNVPDPGVTIWFQYTFMDEAFFHCFAALSGACMDFVTGTRTRYSEYCHHMALALRLINERLSSAEALADINLASIIYLCLLSSAREMPLQTRIHFDGLCQMIEARGGVDRFDGNPGLIAKARRIDVDLALQLGDATKLERSSEVPSAIAPRLSGPPFEVYCPLTEAIGYVDLRVLSAAQDIMNFVYLMNSNSIAEKLSAYAFQGVITTTCYRLLQVEPLGSTHNLSPLADAVYLGLLSFMTTFLIQIGRQRYLRYELLSRKFKEALNHPAFQANVDPATHLWLLVIAGISVLGKDEHLWLKTRLTKVAEQLGHTEWELARTLLSNYPWVEKLHDRLASRLWDSCVLVATKSKEGRQ